MTTLQHTIQLELSSLYNFTLLSLLLHYTVLQPSVLLFAFALYSPKEKVILNHRTGRPCTALDILITTLHLFVGSGPLFPPDPHSTPIYLFKSQTKANPPRFPLPFKITPINIPFLTAFLPLPLSHSMGFFVEDYSCLLVTHVLYQAALVLAIMRWALSWFRNRTQPHLPNVRLRHPSSDKILECLVLATFGDIKERSAADCDTCAVCLGKFRASDEVRELRNCRHVFHRECIDRWVDHEDDNHNSCPLCRAPLLTAAQCLAWTCTRSEPSWAVEKILYLFGDDLYM